MKYLEKYADTKALVTGGAGLIGSNLVRKLLDLNAENVIILDDLSGSVKANIPRDSRVEFIHGSILNESMLKRAFVKRPDFVFHLAAHFANQKAIDHPDINLEINGLGMMKVLQGAEMVNAQRFVFSSSGCATYGSKAPVPLVEDFVTMNLDSPYQIHKFLGELYCNFFHDYYELPTVRLRFFNVYGPWGTPGRYKNVIPNFIYWAMQGEPLPVMGSGNETRDYTFVDDLVDGLLRAGIAKEAVGQAINLGSGVETKTKDLAKKVNEVTGNKAGIKQVPIRDWDKQDGRRVASIKKAKKFLGYQPQFKLKDGLKKTHKWFKENKKRIEQEALF